MTVTAAPLHRNLWPLFLLWLGLLTGCQPVWYLHDRHALAWEPVRTYAQTHPGTTLVLVDYHPDAGGMGRPRNSTNWVGHLVAEGLVSRVLWVSAREFGPGQRTSRERWLHRVLADDSPTTVAQVLAAFVVADGADLLKWAPQGPWVLSIDSDVFAHDAGPDPGAWLADLGVWTRVHRPEVGTWALSSAYQPDGPRAWGWTSAWWSQPWMAGVRGRWTAGTPGLVPEGPEEARSWASWARGTPFWPGLGVWQGTPGDLRQLLVNRGTSGLDAGARDALAAWADPDRRDLEAAVPSTELDRWRHRAAQGVLSTWASGPPPEPTPSVGAERGLAVRLTGHPSDRGCLAWYRGVDDPGPVLDWCASQALSDPRYPPVRAEEAPDLTVEVSVFGPWTPLADPRQVRLGWDSLLLVSNGEKTLLQSSLAVERGYGTEVFLERLSRKAGLGPRGWMAPGVRFLKAPTLVSLGELTTRR